MLNGFRVTPVESIGSTLKPDLAARAIRWQERFLLDRLGKQRTCKEACTKYSSRGKRPGASRGRGLRFQMVQLRGSLVAGVDGPSELQ